MPRSSVLGPDSTPHPVSQSDSGMVQEIVNVFQAAQDSAKEPDLADFLPDPQHPLYRQILCELIARDMQAHWLRDEQRRLRQYQERFPEAFADRDCAKQLVQCEYQLRTQAGEEPRYEDYEEFGSALELDKLPVTVHGTIRSDAPSPIKLAPRASDSSTLANDDPFPAVGSTLFDFDIVNFIGQGAFAKVFLARQRQLSGRFVVLKVSTEKAGEPEVLAQLLHTNIVPIYSLHADETLHATCMPYLGTTTLADVVAEVRVQGLPHSGKYLVETLQERSTMNSALSDGSRREHAPSELPVTPFDISLIEGALAIEPRTRMILDNLEALSYEDAVLWLAAQLADGLAHAHDRGILHRDLKPANILLTNEGQPLLLDFNLAEDTKLREGADAARLGGTLLYMSPEQMRALRGEKLLLDGRSDIYSLGVILFELLTGQFPFSYHKGTPREFLPKMLSDREAGPPKARKWNRNVSPALQAIVQKCMAADPDRRYQTTRDLEEDIQRQLTHRPLKHAREPSLTERFGKWRRRHPRLASLTTVISLSAVFLVGLFSLFHARGERLRHFEANETYDRFEKNFNNVQFLFTNQSVDKEELQRFMTESRQSLHCYDILDKGDWRQRQEVRYLPEDKRHQLETEIAELLLMMARAEAMSGEQQNDDCDRFAAFRRALQFNTLAEQNGAANHLPRTLLDQRATLLGLLNEKEQADIVRKKAQETTAEKEQDTYLSAREHILRGRFQKALPILAEATQKNPNNVPAWFLKGRCHEGLGQEKNAIANFTICIALRPQTAQAYFHRGLVYLRQQDYSHAWTDFSKVIELEPKDCNAYVNRALAWHGLKKTDKAIADLSQALELNAPFTRVYFLRSRFRRETGDNDGAKKDKEEGLTREPGDERSWNARGIAKLSIDSKGALADFREALKVNPNSLAAMSNIAHVLAHVQKDHKEAIAMLDRLVSTHPDYVSGRSARGILHAKAGSRKEALQDARECLNRSKTPANLYRVADIYALTSATEAKDSAEALQLLKEALRQGYGYDLIERDPCLAPLRNDAEFRRLVGAIRVLRK